jgi:CO/xanthine dehydrogenase FAD-binding subunit
MVRNQRIDESVIRAARLKLASEIAPIDDLRSTSTYRLQVAGNLLADCLAQASKKS